MTNLPEPVDVLGVKVHPVTEEQLVSTLVEWARTGEGKKVYYVNAHALNLAYEDPHFRETLNSADLVYCDGFGVKWGAALLGKALPERMTPPDWIDGFLGFLDDDLPLYLLGDERSIVTGSAGRMLDTHPQLRIAGIRNGFFDIGGESEREIVQSIRQACVRVLLVGMGMPRQEAWIDHNLGSLDLGVAISVGALFQYYAGVQRRAPRVLSEHGFEWLGRFVLEPRKTWSRYVLGNPKFVSRVLRARFRE